MTWIGSKIIPDRSRLQTYLYNVKEDIHYLFDGGGIFLSSAGISWIEYLKPEQEIMKGEIYKQGNSKLGYLDFE